jgi:N utilization substance protein A
MDAANLNMVIDQVSKDKGIDRMVLVRALEEAILASAKKAFGAERALNAEFNEEKGAVDLTQAITVVETVEDTFNQISMEECAEREIEVEAGDEMVFPIFYLQQDADEALEQDEEYGDILQLKTYRRSFGRIAAQTAKQVIIQRIRDAERYLIFSEYKDRKDEMVTGIVRRFERGNIIVDLGRAEAIIPIREQCPRESYRTGDRIQAYVIDVQEHSRGPQIVLSRTCPQLLAKLFEIEVPEIHEGIVKIESAAREPGSRAKIAVSSNDRDVDPVGACVGMKGSRVQAVVQELRGEKIDIVPYSEDPATFVCNALQPAEVSRVLIDEGSHTMEIIVPDDQLSLAIGRKGQNVRLASQLAGWRLDIHSESRISEIKDRAWASLSKVKNCGEFLIQTLYNHGIRSAEELLEANHEFLVQFPGIEADNVAEMLQSARQVAADEAEELKRLKEQADHAAQVSDAAKALQGILGLDSIARLRMVRGVGDNAFEKLNVAGFDSVEKIAECDIGELADTCEITEQKAKQLRFGANHLINEEKDIHKRAAQFDITVVDDVVQIPGMEEEEEEIEETPEATEEVAAEVVVAEAAGTTEADESAAELA